MYFRVVGHLCTKDYGIDFGNSPVDGIFLGSQFSASSVHNSLTRCQASLYFEGQNFNEIPLQIPLFVHLEGNTYLLDRCAPKIIWIIELSVINLDLVIWASSGKY